MRNHFLFAAALATLMTCACSVEPADVADVRPEEDGYTILTAGFAGDEDETRTVRQADGKVFWSPADAISVIKGTDRLGSKFISTNTEPAATADFRGIMPSGDDAPFWALYPYDPNAYFDGEYLWTNLPNEQEGVPGTFADNTFVSAAYADSDHLTFSHVTGGLKLSFSDVGISKVTMKTNRGRIVAGRMGLSLVGSKPALANMDSPNYDYVGLTPRGGYFVPGKAYHLVTCPGYFIGGITLIFDRVDGAIAYLKINKTALVQPGHFLVMENVDKKLEWEEDVFTIDAEDVSVSGLGGAFTVHFRSLVDYHVEPAVDWIHLKSIDGNPRLLEGATATFTVDANPGEARDGLVTICNDKTGNCFPVMVSQESGVGMKTVKHHSLGMRFTATWCVWCPYMDKGFVKAKERLGDRFDYVNLHGANSDLYFPGTDDLQYIYDAYSFPTGIMDGRLEIENANDTDVTAQSIVDAVGQQEDFYPARTAVGLASTLDGRNLTVNAEVFARKAGTYKLTVFLLEDGIVNYQKGGGDDYVHDKVARMALTASEGDNVRVTSANGTQTASFTVSVPEIYNLDKMSVLAFVQCPFGDLPVIQSGDYGGWYIDNCRVAAVGATAPLEVE